MGYKHPQRIKKSEERSLLALFETRWILTAATRGKGVVAKNTSCGCRQGEVFPCGSSWEPFLQRQGKLDGPWGVSKGSVAFLYSMEGLFHLLATAPREDQLSHTLEDGFNQKMVQLYTITGSLLEKEKIGSRTPLVSVL